MTSPSVAIMVSLVVGALTLGAAACADDMPSGPLDRSLPGLAQLDVSTLAAPANDDVDNATVITAPPFSDTLSIVEATVAGDDRLYEEGCSAGVAGNTVWYEYTPPNDMRLSADVLASRPDVVIFLYTGTRGNLTFLRCSDGLPFPIVFDVVGGTTYRFMLHGRERRVGVSAAWNDDLHSADLA
jgi:hypothetical protein